MSYDTRAYDKPNDGGVRVGDCAGTVHKPHDITRVKLDGVLIAHDFETRFVRPTPYDEEVPF